MAGSIRLCVCVCVCVCDREGEREKKQNERDGEEVFVSYQVLRVEARQDMLRNDKCRICYLN